MVTDRYFRPGSTKRTKQIASWIQKIAQRTTDIDLDTFLQDEKNPERLKVQLREGYEILADIFGSVAAHQSTIETKRFVFRFNKYGNGDGSIMHQNHYHIMDKRTGKCEIPTLRVEMKGGLKSRIQQIKNVSSRL